MTISMGTEDVRVIRVAQSMMLEGGWKCGQGM